MIQIAAVLLLLAAAIHDIRKREVTTRCLALAGALAAASVVSVLVERESTPLRELSALIPGALLLSLAFVSEGGLGYGDGLLSVLIGPVFGLEKMAAGICLAFFFCAVLSAVLLAAGRVNRKTSLPFVPFLASAMGVVSLVPWG